MVSNLMKLTNEIGFFKQKQRHLVPDLRLAVHKPFEALEREPPSPA